MPVAIDGDTITAIARHEGRTWQVRFVGDLLAATPDDTPDLFHLPDPIYEDAGQPGPRAVIIDRRVYRLYGEQFSTLFASYGIEPVWLHVSAGERTKSLATYGRLAERLIGLGLVRHSQPLFLIGGGVCGDVGAFLAGTLARGTPAIRIPTSLLALADAGVAAKTGVNHAAKKNALGTYDPPPLALHCLTFCATESQRRISNALAEIAKAALMDDRALWSLLIEHGRALRRRRMQTPVGRDVLWRAVLVMLGELSDNMRERRLARSMDFGHAITPTAELMHSKLWHGEWVAIDMALFVVVSARRKLIDWPDADGILSVLGQTLKLPLWHPLLADRAVLEHALDATARHRGGRLRLPLLHGVAVKEFVDDVHADELADAANVLRDHAARLGAIARLAHQSGPTHDHGGRTIRATRVHRARSRVRRHRDQSRDDRSRQARGVRPNDAKPGPNV
jgi:3-dehydroquinate synthetase